MEYCLALTKKLNSVDNRTMRFEKVMVHLERNMRVYQYNMMLHLDNNLKRAHRGKEQDLGLTAPPPPPPRLPPGSDESPQGHRSLGSPERWRPQPGSHETPKPCVIPSNLSPPAPQSCSGARATTERRRRTKQQSRSAAPSPPQSHV